MYRLKLAEALSGKLKLPLQPAPVVVAVDPPAKSEAHLNNISEIHMLSPHELPDQGSLDSSIKKDFHDILQGSSIPAASEADEELL